MIFTRVAKSSKFDEILFCRSEKSASKSCFNKLISFRLQSIARFDKLINLFTCSDGIPAARVD